jgi:hypothetical protein
MSKKYGPQFSRWIGILSLGVLLAVPGPALAESFTLDLNTDDISQGEGRDGIKGTIRIKGDQQESQEFGFNLQQLTEGDQSNISIAISDRDQPLLEAIFDFIGFSSSRRTPRQENANPLDTKISGDISSDRSEFKLKLENPEFGDKSPEIRMKVNTSPALDSEP